MTPEIICKGCGKSIQEDVNFCPVCGTTLGKLEEKYIFETMNDYVSTSRGNLDQFLELMENPRELEEKIQERIQGRQPQVFERQREITKKILDRFPEIKRYVIDNPELEFKAFIISTPYEKSPDDFQHDCLLRHLAIEQNGLVNFSLGSTEIATNLYAFDVPIWAPKKVGHELLLDQKQQVERCLPLSQKKFLFSAEPWWVCSNVFDLDGRWVNWKLLFETEGLMDYIQEEGVVPLNFQIFSNMEYSDFFSIAGTRGDGEILVGVHTMEESDKFEEHLSELKDFYKLGREPEISIIRISWDTLEYLGLIGISAQQLLKSQRGHFFRKTISDSIIENVEQKTISDAKTVMAGRKSSSVDEFMERLAERFLWHEMQGQEGIVKITHGIPRELKKEYRMLGDKA
ncbi:MAG: hypothetical protein AYK19_09815 [Theionarchaea archaeon DG-70-1]|nr:MAG: hypothetical protein AYK19_09815 [Theionarchaea archaeon DG-70-1]